MFKLRLLGAFSLFVSVVAVIASPTPAKDFVITPEPTYGISVSCTFDNTPVVGDGAVVSQGEVAGLCHDTRSQLPSDVVLGKVVWSNGDRLGAIATRRPVVIVLGGR